MKIGAEQRNKVVLLGVLLLVAGYVVYSNVFTDDMPPASGRSATTPRSTARTDVADLTQPRQATAERAPRPAGRAAFNQEFKPKFRIGKPGDAVSPDAADPTLRLELLAKVQAVDFEGGERNLFQFGAAPPPKAPEPKIIPKSPSKQANGGSAVADAKPAAPVKPPPPPIPLKFYGYTSLSAATPKRAFFLDGEDIIVANEGDTVKKRYKVVRIGINSVVMEDTEGKSQQTLPLEEQPNQG